MKAMIFYFLFTVLQLHPVNQEEAGEIDNLEASYSKVAKTMEKEKSVPAKFTLHYWKSCWPSVKLVVKHYLLGFE